MTPPDGDLSSTIALLAAVPLFKHLAPDELRLIFAVGVERSLPPRTMLGRGGERIDALWVILSGQVDVTSPLTNAVSTITAPQIWGAASLVSPFQPNGSAVTRTECRMLQLNAPDVRALAEQNPRLGAQLYHALATHVFRRLRDLTAAAQRRRA